MFRHVVRRAEDLGMVVNASKTAMICISGADFKADVFILDSKQNRIGCTTTIKALGVYFSNNLSMEELVKHLVRLIRTRYWALRNLKANGFTSEELVHIYKTMLRPIAEYGAVMYLSSLTDDQDERLERLQDHALKCIFGPGKSSKRLRGMAGLETLRQRREGLAEKFANKCARDPAFDHWVLRETVRRSARNKREEYREEKARCECLKNSPIFYFRRILNGKIGKTYGSRNKCYREDIITEEAEDLS